MLALARANSYAAPSEPTVVDVEAPLAHPAEMGAFEPQFAGPAPSHGGLAVSQSVWLHCGDHVCAVCMHLVQVYAR